MLSSSIINGTNIIAISYSGSLNTEEMENAQNLMSRMTAEHDTVQLLLEYGEIAPGRVEPEAAWRDLQSIGLVDDMERIAIVADQQWLQKITDALDSLISTELRSFDLGQRDQALAWLAT